MKPKILFSRHEPKDFDNIKEQLEQIVETDNATIFLESGFILVPDQTLINNDYDTFLKIYEVDLNGKMNIEMNPEILNILSRMGIKDDSLNTRLYQLASDNKWDFKHEIIHPEILFTLQQSYFVYNNLPHIVDFSDKYLNQARTVLNNIQKRTQQRDERFIQKMENYSQETGKEAISTRGTFHNYLIKSESERLQFYGNKEIWDKDPISLVMHKKLLGLEK